MIEGTLTMTVTFVDADGAEDVQTFIVKVGRPFNPVPGAIVKEIVFKEVGNAS